MRRVREFLNEALNFGSFLFMLLLVVAVIVLSVAVVMFGVSAIVAGFQDQMHVGIEAR